MAKKKSNGSDIEVELIEDDIDKNKKTKKIVVIKKRSGPKLKVVDKKQTQKNAKKASPAKNTNGNREFFRRVQKDMENILPEKMPWKIGIDKDIFEVLKSKYDGQRKRLRRVIGSPSSPLKNRIESLAYIEAGVKAPCRYGLNSEQHPLSDEHREKFQKMVSEFENRKPEKKASK